jgi:hypothetical protein
MRTALAIFGFTIAIQAQDMPPSEAIKKDMAERAFTVQTLQFVRGQVLTGSTVKGAPYSAEALNQTTQTLADGSHIVNQSSSMLYRDSEGRERREESIGKLGVWNAEGAPVKTVFISDPVARVTYTLDPHSHIAQKMPAGVVRHIGPALGITTRDAGIPMNPTGERVIGFSRIGAGEAGAVYAGGGTSPAKVENLGRQTIEGVPADGTRTTITIPAGQIGNERDLNIVSERWYSPELQVTVLSKHSDPRMGETVYKLTNISRAEPLRSMFEVPPDYAVDISNYPPVTTRSSKPVGKEEEQH